MPAFIEGAPVTMKSATRANTMREKFAQRTHLRCAIVARARAPGTAIPKSRPHHEGSRRYSRARAQLHGSDIGATAGRYEHFQKMAYMDQCTLGAVRARRADFGPAASADACPGLRDPNASIRLPAAQGGPPAWASRPPCALARTAACGAPRGVRRARAVWHSSRRVGWLGFRLPDPGFDPTAGRRRLPVRA